MHNRLRPTGFNFAEVLFAVMLLGIGFIMVAALFPVALVQTKITQEETAGASIARGGANYLEQIATDYPTPAVAGTNFPVLPATNNLVRTLAGDDYIRGAMTLSSDGRYGWVPFFRRAGSIAPDDDGDPSTPLRPKPDWASFAQVYMVPVAVRNRSAFDRGYPNVIAAADGSAVLVANVVDSTATPLGVDYIEFPAGAGLNDTDDNYTAVGEGSYVIIANVTAPAGAFARIGHIFRIGSPTEGQTGYPRRWTLVPGNDYVPLRVDIDPDPTVEDYRTPTTLDDAAVFVVGRELADPSATYGATNVREGTGQDVSAYTTFVNIK